MISDTLIDSSFIEKKLVNIFPNSIVIDSSLKVISISKGIKDLLLFDENECENWPINNLIKSSKRKFISQIKILYEQGFFEPTMFELINSFGYGVKVKIAAFHLGLISDLNGKIVLMIQDLDKIKKYQKQLTNKIMEFNELVYRTSHDLKGPIATMQGLVNIAEYESESIKLKELIANLNNHLKILERKTSIVSSFGEKAEELTLHPQKLTLKQLHEMTQGILNNTIENHEINYIQSSEEVDHIYFDQGVLRQIIKSVIETVSSFDIKDDPSIRLKIISKKNNLQLIYSIKGFKCNKSLISILKQAKFLIKEALINESYQKFYNLKNLVTKYHGYIEFDCFKINGTFQYRVFLPQII